MMHQTVTCLTSHVSFVWLWRSVSFRLPARHLKAFCHFLSCNTDSFSLHSQSRQDHTEIPAGCWAAGRHFSCMLWWLFLCVTEHDKGHRQTHSMSLQWNKLLLLMESLLSNSTVRVPLTFSGNTSPLTSYMLYFFPTLPFFIGFIA